MQAKKPWDLAELLPMCAQIGQQIKEKFSAAVNEEQMKEHIKSFGETLDILKDGIRVSNIAAPA